MQETKDGELVVLHDLQRVLEASRHAPINTAVIAQLAAEVDDVSRAHVQVGRRRYLQRLMNLDCPYSELDYKHNMYSGYKYSNCWHQPIRIHREVDLL